MNKKILLLTLCSLLSFIAFSQNDEIQDNGARLLSTAKTLSTIQLPTLDELFESAKASPILLEVGDNLEVNERELKSRKRDWLNFFKLNASYSYGVSNSYIMYQETEIPISDKYAENAQSFYIVGAGIALPLYTIFNMRNRIKQQEANVRVQGRLYDQRYEELKLRIIDAYLTVQAQANILPHIIENVSLAQSQYEEAKMNFINGKIDNAGLSTMKTNQIKVLQDFENTILSLKRGLYMLEIYSEKKIISK